MRSQTDEVMPGDYPGGPAMLGKEGYGDEAGKMPHCDSPRRERPIQADRKAQLFTLANGIAAQVSATVPPGRERCLLREMVQMLLDN